MIFGRKRKRAAEESAAAKAPVVQETEEAQEEPSGSSTTPDPETEATPELSEQEQRWASWDAEFDRDEGPFDLDEVDLEADDVKRIDLGTLIVTPFPKMSMQLQVDKKKEKVQAILVGDGSSAIEVAVFAGPSRSSMLGEIRGEVLKATERMGGRADVVKGPFGAEIHRRLPVKDAKGNAAMHLSRTWLAEGPGWVLRGVVMGKAALNFTDAEAQLTIFEFFSNLVVRRGTQPAVPGSILPMTVPQLDPATQATVSQTADETPQG